MKKLSLLLASTVLLAACGKQASEEPAAAPAPQEAPASAPAVTASAAQPPAEAASQSQAFDVNTVPVSDKLVGEFPYFNLPPDYRFTNSHSSHGKGEIKDYDREYFYFHGIYTPMEGKSFKADIQANSDQSPDKKFSALEIQKNLDDLIASLGGVKVNSGGPLKDGESERLKEIDPNAYLSGYLHSANNYSNVHTYVIRKPDQMVWVQYNLGSDTAYFTVLETKPFETKISIVPASNIQKELDAAGKAVVYINFDVDKATLKSDGVTAVGEIAKVLQNSADLRLSIEGHTDNTGEAAHNQQLSLSRAQAVRDELLKLGIDGARLQAAGYGADRPLQPNDSEVNKAQNRRVELVKL